MASRLVTVTFLQMFQPPPQPDIDLPPPLLALRSHQCSPAFYRFLYSAVGEGWYWVDRNAWSDQEITRQLHRPEVQLWVLYHDGTPAGYSELQRQGDEVNVCYFGLMRDYLGKGLGRLWLGWTLHQAWRESPSRVWLNTCDLDHPAALPLYQKLGLQAYNQVQEWREL